MVGYLRQSGQPGFVQSITKDGSAGAAAARAPGAAGVQQGVDFISPFGIRGVADSVNDLRQWDASHDQIRGQDEDRVFASLHDSE